MDADYRLELRDVSKSFGEVEALHDVNFQLGRNEVVGLLGDNGAGKSTLIKIVTGYHQPTASDLIFEGEKVHGLTVPRARASKGETSRPFSASPTVWAGRGPTTRRSPCRRAWGSMWTSMGSRS